MRSCLECDKPWAVLIASYRGLSIAIGQRVVIVDGLLLRNIWFGGVQINVAVRASGFRTTRRTMWAFWWNR